MAVKDPPPRCPECGQSLAAAPDSFRTLALENQQLRQQIAELRKEVLYWNAGGFVSSEIAKSFHRRDCKWAEAINPSYMIEYESHEEAVRAGKKPCKTCRS